jgi:hypothetical protein
MGQSTILKNQIILQKKLYIRMHKNGYSNVSSFVRGSGLDKHLKFEAALRCFNDEMKPVNALTMALVMKFLGFTFSELHKAIEDLGGSSYKLLVANSESRKLEIWEEGLLSVARKIMDKPEGFIALANLLGSITAEYGIDASEEIARIRVPKKIRITHALQNKHSDYIKSHTPNKGT